MTRADKHRLHALRNAFVSRPLTPADVRELIQWHDKTYGQPVRTPLVTRGQFVALALVVLGLLIK